MTINSWSFIQNISNWRLSGSAKTNSLFNIISQQPDIDKGYLCAKDPYEAKYQFLINKRESRGLKHLNDSKAFIKYSNDMDDIYKNIEEYNPIKKRKILIAFDDTIADMLSNKKKLTQWQMSYLSEVERQAFLIFLIHNLILLSQKILDQILCTILLR